jgi:hypothetical protein
MGYGLLVGSASILDMTFQLGGANRAAICAALTKNEVLAPVGLGLVGMLTLAWLRRQTMGFIYFSPLIKFPTRRGRPCPSGEVVNIAVLVTKEYCLNQGADGLQ